MPSAAALRRQIEAALEQRIPSALSPRPRTIRETAPTGIADIDALLTGGLPVGAITELVGPLCSGRTTLALATLAELTASGRMVAWVDASDAFDPESAAAAGIDLRRQLWVRCGGAPAAAPTPPVPPTSSPAAFLGPTDRTPSTGGGCGSPHPRGESRGLSQAIDTFLAPGTFARAIAPRGPGAPVTHRPNLRRDKSIGTPGAPNYKLTDLPGAPSNRSPHREEQVATDRLPARRGANVKLPERTPRSHSAAQIAFTGQVASARVAAAPTNTPWTDNRNNAAGRGLKSSPGSIAAGLAHLGQQKPHTGASSPVRLPPGSAQAPQPGSSQPGRTPAAQAATPASLAGDPPTGLARAASPVWKALDQALRATDLILAGGGFSAVVLDLGSTAPHFTWRIPLATWFRFRAAAERSRTVFIVLTQHPSARSAAELVLNLAPAEPQATTTVLTGTGFRVTVDRQRFESQQAAPSTPHGLHLVSTRKPPQGERSVVWQRRAAWNAGWPQGSSLRHAHARGAR